MQTAIIQRNLYQKLYQPLQYQNTSIFKYKYKYMTKTHKTGIGANILHIALQKQRKGKSAISIQHVDIEAHYTRSYHVTRYALNFAHFWAKILLGSKIIHSLGLNDSSMLTLELSSYDVIIVILSSSLIQKSDYV